MANKALAKRQKLVVRVRHVQKALKPRNPVAAAARKRVTGPHQKSISTERQLQKRLLNKKLSGGEDDE